MRDLELSQEEIKTTEREAARLLALGRIRGIGTVTARKLYAHFGSLQAIWEAEPPRIYEALRKSRVRDVGQIVAEIRSKKARLLQSAQHELEVLAKNDVHLIIEKDPRFPERLKFISNPPYWLFVHGDPALLQRRGIVAVVGTRSPTEYGTELAHEIGSRLAERGIVVLSGLAEGIDASAHQGAVDAGGPSIAVLGTGILVTFPAATMDLRFRILDQGGAIVTEYFPHASYNKQQFIERNRIQAALSNAVIPVQAREQGGTVHTIRFAEEFGTLLIGVTLGQPPRHPQNEVLALLRSHGHPVIDIAREEEALWMLLGDLAADQKSRGASTDDERIRIFGPMIQAFRRALRRNPPNSDDFRWFVRQLEQAYKQVHNPNAGKGRSV